MWLAWFRRGAETHDISTTTPVKYIPWPPPPQLLPDRWSTRGKCKRRKKQRICTDLTYPHVPTFSPPLPSPPDACVCANFAHWSETEKYQPFPAVANDWCHPSFMPWPQEILDLSRKTDGWTGGRVGLQTVRGKEIEVKTGLMESIHSHVEVCSASQKESVVCLRIFTFSKWPRGWVGGGGGICIHSNK